MQEVVRITLAMTEDGQVKIDAAGPSSSNQVILLGLLEFGKAALTTSGGAQAPATPPLLLARGSLPRNGR